LFNLLAGIFSPFLTPRDLRKAPGFLIAFLISNYNQGGIAKGCGGIKENRRKVTTVA